MKTILHFLACMLISLSAISQTGPEFIFVNPVLVSGTPLKQGAIYRFNNVKTGVDATIRLKKFSRTDIVMPTVDNSALGWDKAFQPEFGLTGTVAPFQNWYIDFEVIFYQAGTNTRKFMDTVDFTALDVDGDGVSISEYVTYDRPNSIIFAPLSSLVTAPAGVLGDIALCGECGLSSAIISCSNCGGAGMIAGVDDGNCDGTGKLHNDCAHPYQGGTGTSINGPVNNFAAIDTSATQVMSVYRYFNRDKINFRYGAKSGALSSNGSGVRLNSMWFRKFNLAPMNVLPVKLTSFTASLHADKVNLRWMTASEINVSHFTVEKSSDGKNFTSAGMVFAQGTETAGKNYEFTDAVGNEKNAILYYRLKTNENDGSGQISEVKLIRLSSKTETIAITTYPNPVTNELRVTVPANWQNKKVTYEVLAVNGQVAAKTNKTNSSQTESLSVSNLQPGVYIVKVSCEGNTAQQKIIKQ